MSVEVEEVVTALRRMHVVTSRAMPPVTRSPRPGVGALIHATRRERAMSVSGLAAASGVDEDAVRRVEHGETWVEADARAMLEALDVDPRPHVGGTPQGPVAVPPLDPAHAKAMAYLADVAQAEDGWLLHPDVAARLEAAGGEAGERSSERAAMTARWRSSLMVGLPSLLGFSGCATGELAFILDDPFGLGLHGWSQASMVGVLAAGLALSVIGATIWSGRMDAAGLSLELTRSQPKRRANLGRVGFLVSRRGVTVLKATPAGLVRSEHLASSVTSVDVIEHDGTHVSVLVRTIVGDVALPWIPRVRDVLDVLTSWGPPMADVTDGLQ